MSDHQRHFEGNPAAANACVHAIESAAAQDEQEIAARFPALSADVADRLLAILMPNRPASARAVGAPAVAQPGAGQAA